MDNIGINILGPHLLNTKEVKSDKVNSRSSEGAVSQNTDNAFDKQLNRVKNKEVKLAKSIVKDVIKEGVKDIPVNKALDLKELDEKASQEAVYQSILSIIQTILEIPSEEITVILEKMDITPIELLDKETFKEFLTWVYPEYDEEQLLFNEGNLKDISKLFGKLEQISEWIEGDGGKFLVQKLMVEDQVIHKTLTQIENTTSTQSVSEESPNDPQMLAPSALVKDVSQQGLSKDKIIESVLPNESEKATQSSEQLNLGITMPVQAFHTAIGANLWPKEAKTLTGHTQVGEQPALTHQIINKLDISALGRTKEITMELSPKELGNLSIKLVETNGALTAQIRVENEKTKDLLLSEMNQLKETLQKQGLSISEVKVDIRQNPHQTQMEQQKQKSSKRIQELIDKHLLEELEDYRQIDEATGEIIETEVNYTV